MNAPSPSAPAVSANARSWTSAAVMLAAVALALSGCGTDQPTQPGPGTSAAASTSGTTTSTGSTPEASSPETTSPEQLAASLDWPEGTEDFALNICVSIGETTIQGGGESTDWKLSFDANLLTPADTGTLQVSHASDNTVRYDADITTLTVQPDGTFDATGQDPAGAAFRLTGTCTLSW